MVSNPSLGQRLSAARERAFVGRADELALFRSSLDGEECSSTVLFLQGPGGVGKSTLLRRFADEARSAGRPVAEIDGRSIDLSAAVFETEAAAVLGDGRSVLLIDTFEECQGLESWLRDRFLPRLPVGALVVMAGRLPLDAQWRADPGWAEALRVVALRNLPPDDATNLLDARGVPSEMHASLLRFAGGHPLALCLAAETAMKEDSGAVDWSPSLDVYAMLLPRLVGDVPSPAHRHALEVCALAHTTTEDLLRAVLPGEDAGALFRWLRRLPFVESGRHGIHPHDVVRETLDADLRWRDPSGYREMHLGIRAYLLGRARGMTDAGLSPTLAALNHLHRHSGVVPEYLSGRRDGEVQEEAYRPEDRPGLLRLAEEAEGVQSAAVVDFWLARQPDNFHVHRRRDTGEVVGFMAWLRLSEPKDEETSADPVVAAAWQYVRQTGPVRAGEHIALARFMICPETYQRPSPAMDLVIQRVLAGWLYAERIAWSFNVHVDGAFWQRLMTYCDHARVLDEPSVGGRPYVLFGHDWRKVPLEAWLDLMSARQLGQPARPATQMMELAVLSRPEFDVAVRDALRAWHRPEALAANHLTRSRLVAEQGRSLREVLADAVDTLHEDPQEARWHRVLATTYFHRTPTQEAAAERLGLPFSTYRRHLARGTERVCERLWQQELYGVTQAAAGE